MIDKNKIKKEIENSGQGMWALSDIFLEVDKIFAKLGSCGNCEYYCSDDGLCTQHHGFVYDNFFCAEFKETKCK